MGVWRWTQKPDGNWQKPPFMALQPDRNASTYGSQHVGEYRSRRSTLWRPGAPMASRYMLTKADPFAAIDVDHCRDVSTHSIDRWAQNFLDVGRHSYSEMTPSGTGCRILGIGERRQGAQQVQAGDRR